VTWYNVISQFGYNQNQRPITFQLNLIQTRNLNKTTNDDQNETFILLHYGINCNSTYTGQCGIQYNKDNYTDIEGDDSPTIYSLNSIKNRVALFKTNTAPPTIIINAI
jgi:hypothetical protein